MICRIRHLSAAAFAIWLVGSFVLAQIPTTQPAAASPHLNISSLAYRLTPGPYQVKTVEELILHDAARNKDLPLKVRFPQAATGPRPVIVFSHGAGGSGEAFSELTTHWASYGYVVILPTHSDSIKLLQQKGEDLSWRKNDLKQLIRNVHPYERLDDVRFILDSFDTLEAQIPGLKDAAGKGLLDRKRIGMAGHSAGALTTQMAFGVKVRQQILGEPVGVGDPRFQAAIVISGQGLTKRMFTEKSWEDLRKPMLVITGSLDKSSLTAETPESRQQPFEFAPAGDKYLIFIEGATHSSFAGKKTSALLGEKPTSDLGMITGVTASGTLAFWDAYLADNADAKAYLQSDKLVQFSGQQAELKRK